MLCLQSTWNLMVKIEINFSSDWSEKKIQVKHQFKLVCVLNFHFFFCNDGSGSDCVCMWKDKSMMINVYLFVCLFVRFQLDQLRMNKKCSMYQNKLQNKQTEKKQSSFWLSKRKKNVMKFQPFFSGVIFNHNFSTTILLDKQTIRIDRLSNCFWLINFTHTHKHTPTQNHDV